MKLSFYGAARQVTGSMYLLETDGGYRILVDCGLDLEHQGSKDKASSEKSAYGIFPFEPSSIHVVVLTHAHIDHTGMLPILVKEGFEGQILCSTPTYYLAQILLHDSALLHQRRLKRSLEERKKNPRVEIKTETMFFTKHVEETTDRFVTIPLSQKFKLNDEVSVYFNHAGHLLGAANLIFNIKTHQCTLRLGFSGDIGRKDYPLLQNPAPFPAVDYLVCESTYGNRVHTTQKSPEEALAEVIDRTCVQKPGRLIIPAFSVGRSQALFYTLNKLYKSNKISRQIKVFADSPMAKESSVVYEKFIKQLNKETQQFYEDHDELFDFEQFEFVEDIKRSKALSNHYEPCIIVSASGMISGGRVEHHVKQNLENPNACILIIGYCAEGTIGHMLMQGAREIPYKGKLIEVRAEIEVLDCFSAHGDQHDLLRFVSQQDSRTLKTLFLTHGEPKAMHTFAEQLQSAGYMVEIPSKGSEYILNG